MADITARSEVAGSVWKIVAKVGERIEPGGTVMIIECMKMEIPVITEVGGVVQQLLVEESAPVSEGQVVAVLSN